MKQEAAAAATSTATLQPETVATPAAPTSMQSASGASVAGSAGPAGSSADVPRVRDALDYLEKVKRRFCNRPVVYSQFLEIMKEFKAQTINTEGVIKRVTNLFHGNRELILGFNQFLPPGYKIVEPSTPDMAPKPTVEFNHAVKYVAKIKQRFEQKPEIYEDFLEVLHAYQEKRSSEGAIEQVKAQVQHLFRGHPDLLDDFNYFLPPESSGVWPPKKATKIKKRKTLDKVIPSRQPLMAAAPDDRLTAPPHVMPPSAAAAAISVFPPDSKKELQLFDKIKASTPKSLYVQFLRCINLYSCNIISRAELVTLVEDLFSSFPKYSDFATKFKESIGYNEWEENQLMTHMRSNFYAFISSVDFTTCKQVTPSYRELPKDVPVPPCTGRTVLGDAVLNDTCISIPTGTEDQSFKSSRKNQYEEALFRVEDERYELDMMVENNAAAIRVLQPIADQIDTMSAEQAASFKFDDNVDILHIRAMARLYGDQWFEIVRLLKSNPTSAVPVILKRLKQKDKEWRKVRISMKKTWRDTVKQNYHRSLDHRSFQFKSEEKKRLSAKCLVAELKEDHEKAFGEDARASSAAQPCGLDLLPASRTTRTLYTYCMTFSYPDKAVHRDLHTLITKCTDAATAAAPDLRNAILTFWHGFVEHLVGARSGPDAGDGPGGNGYGPGGDTPMVDAAPPPPQSPSPPPLPPQGSTKPVRLMMETWKPMEKVSPVRRHTRPSRLFFGNMSFYVFFRLHEFLYTRWKVCRDLALSKKNGAVVYEQFKILVNQLLDNELDQTAFEDMVREKIGAGSYQVFTIDKLIAQLVKQMQTLVSTPTNQKLVDLYKYEFARSSLDRCERTLERSAQLARTYLSNYTSIAVDDHSCVQIEYFEDTDEMGIGYVDGLMPCEPKSGSHDWNNYIAEYMADMTPEFAASQVSQPFLSRNVRRAKAVSRDALTGVHLDNGLQTKICMRTYKVHYVEETEDVCWRRPGRARAHAGRRRAARAQRFHAWCAKQHARTSDADAAAVEAPAAGALQDAAASLAESAAAAGAMEDVPMSTAAASV